MVRRCRGAVLLLAAPGLLGCIDVGGVPRMGVYGRLTTGPGVVFLERGHVQMGTFERFGLIGEDGYFEVDLPVPGPWGVHLYLDYYFYLPLEVEVREDFLTPVDQPSIAWGIIRSGPAWGASGMQPIDPYLLAPIEDDDLSDNPVIDAPMVEQSAPGSWRVQVGISDPDGNMSRQALVGNVQTGAALALNAPAPPINDNFPDGTYTGLLYLDDVDPTGDWYFVAADHGCSNSPVTRVMPR